MEQLYVNILKRPSGKLSMSAYKTREVADMSEAVRPKGHFSNNPATRVACIRLNVETLCVEGRYDE